MIAPFEYCTQCGLVYCHIQNIDCVVCHGSLEPIDTLRIEEVRPMPKGDSTDCVFLTRDLEKKRV